MEPLTLTTVKLVKFSEEDASLWLLNLIILVFFSAPSPESPSSVGERGGGAKAISRLLSEIDLPHWLFLKRGSSKERKITSFGLHYVCLKWTLHSSASTRMDI
jgi:hypothetical protein